MKPFSVDDLYFHQTVRSLHAVPGVPGAVAAVRRVDRDSDQSHVHLWWVARGAAPRQLTQGAATDSGLRLSPDGRRLAFLSDRAGGAPQPHVLPLDGGEARQVGHFERGAVQLRWTHDGQALLATAAQPVDPDSRGRRGGPAPQRSGNEPEVCWRLPYKADGVGFLLQREVHLFRVALDGSDTHRLTDGAFDVDDFCPSPDGTRIAYTRTREGRFAHRSDLWLCEWDCNRHRRLTDGLALVAGPAWSPDGRSIAFCGAQREGDAVMRLWLLDCASGQVRALGPAGLEVADSDSLHWTQDNDALLLVRAHRGRHELVRVGLDDQLAVLATGDRQVGAFAVSQDGLYFSQETPVAPSEVLHCAHAGGQEQACSRFNPWWDERIPLELQARSFQVPDGHGGQERIDGWLLRARDAEGPLPLLDDVHGGPASYALLDYDSTAYWQVLCARGWAVLMLNAAGSASDGEEFCSRLAGRWGELDLPQHLAALEQLQDAGLADDRMAVAGKSYGGFFTSWAIGHCDRFRAAVVMAPVGNLETHYGTSDGGYYADPLYVNSQPEFDRARARALSPVQAIEKATTPTLFLQGKDDERTPKCQSEELFVSLYRAGQTPTEMVLYPGENHHFLDEGRPSTRRDAAQRIVDWVTRHIGQAAPPMRSAQRGGRARTAPHTQPDAAPALQREGAR